MAHTYPVDCDDEPKQAAMVEDSPFPVFVTTMTTYAGEHHKIALLHDETSNFDLRPGHGRKQREQVKNLHGTPTIPSRLSRSIPQQPWAEWTRTGLIPRPAVLEETPHLCTYLLDLEVNREGTKKQDTKGGSNGIYIFFGGCRTIGLWSHCGRMIQIRSSSGAWFMLAVRSSCRAPYVPRMFNTLVGTSCEICMRTVQRVIDRRWLAVLHLGRGCLPSATEEHWA